MKKEEVTYHRKCASRGFANGCRRVVEIISRRAKFRTINSKWLIDPKSEKVAGMHALERLPLAIL